MSDKEEIAELEEKISALENEIDEKDDEICRLKTIINDATDCLYDA